MSVVAVLVVLAIVVVAAAAAAAAAAAVRREPYRTTARDRELQAQLYNLLGEVGACWRAAGIAHWAIGGTALGAVRHGGMIPWDDDIDLGVWAADAARARREVLAKLPVRWVRGRRSDTVVLRGRPDVRVDVFPMRSRNGRVEFSNWWARRRWEREYFAADAPHVLHDAAFGPVTVPVADRPCEYLARAFPGWESTGRIVKHTRPTGAAGPVLGEEVYDPRRVLPRCREFDARG